MEELKLRYRALLEFTNVSFIRYLHAKIDWNSRMIAIVGSRGTGKTTMLL